MEGFLCTWLAYLAYCAGLKRLAASRAAIVANLEPVAAAVLAYWWWNEILPPVGLAGSALVLSGVFVVVREKNTAATA
jgi:drug/metabolite transporter (DMT)-like permease